MASATKGPAAIAENAKRFLANFGEFSAGQKAVVIAVVVALLGGGIMFSRWAATPAYTPLFSNLTGTDASAIVEKLKASGTPYQISDGGATILVPQADVYETRLEMSGEGLPAETEAGSTLAQSSSVTTSKFMEEKNYQQALSRELAKTVKSINGVDSAVVNLALPKADVFMDEKEPATASVLVGLKPGKTLTPQQVTSIVNLVAGGVEGMDPKNVSVVDGDGNTLSMDGSGDAAQQAQADEFNNAASTKLQKMLEGIYGKGNVKATVTTELDFDKKTEKVTDISQNDQLLPGSESTTTEKYENGGGPVVGGVQGPDNIQVPAAEGQGSTYEKGGRTVNNPLDTRETVTESAPGSIKRMSVAVVLNATKAGTADVNEVTQMVTAASGVNAARGDTVNVIKTAFDDSSATENAKALADAKAAEAQEQNVAYAKTAALALLVLIMLIVVLLAFRRRKVKAVEEIALTSLPINLGDITADEIGAGVEELAPVRTPALVAAPVDPALEAAAARRDEVVELVSRQPQEVAELLRGWLADRRS
ncbi:flagellar basal-body MS-ring/collar protein FliF [Kineococcus sp. NUM-3379]